MTALEISGDLSPGELLENSIPVLETERLVLRAPRLEDAGTVAALLNDRNLATMMATIPHPYVEQDAKQWITNTNEAARYRFAFIRKCDTMLIGTCGAVLGANDMHRIGYWLGAEFRGEGFATEGVRAMIDFLFGELHAQALRADVRVVNAASRKIMERCGFQWEAAGLTRIASLGASVPVDKFRLDRALWQSLKSWRGTTYTRQIEMA